MHTFQLSHDESNVPEVNTQLAIMQSTFDIDLTLGTKQVRLM